MFSIIKGNLKFIFIIVIAFLLISVRNEFISLKKINNVFAIYENVPLWTNLLQEKINSFRNDAINNSNTNVDSNSIISIKLDQEYQKYANKAIKQVMDSVGNELDQLTNKTKQLALLENGSPKQTYYIEPNQFRKICDQNTYVLYSRIGGASKRDMRNPKNNGGPPEGEESFWKVPMCNDLSKCHCCINTCMNTVLKKVGKVWLPDCIPNVGFGPMGCSPMCKAPIARGACMAYSSPSHEATYDRDCMGRPTGCAGGGGGCKIIIKDPNNSQFEFIENGVWKKSHAGDNVVPEGTTVKKLNQINALPPGWIGQLDPAPGKCCKCLQMP